MLKASAATERTFSRAPVKETLLWGGLDDTSGSNSCDMDEEDDYFPSNSFMLESSNSLTDSLHDCEWPKSNQYIDSIKRFQGNNTPTNFSKLTTNIRMRVASFPQRDVQAAQLDANLSGIQKSPPPSKRPAASASPMVKFLKNFKEEDKLRSPDTVGKVDEDVTSPCIQSDEAKKFLEEQLEEQTRRLLDAEKKLEVAERLLGEKESEIAKSRELNEEKTLQINILTTELSNLQDEVKLAQSELGEFRQQATLEKSILKENIQVLKSEVMDVLKLLKERDYLKQNQELQVANEDEKRNKELAEQKVASLTKTIKNKEEEIRHLSNRVTALDKAMESGTTKTSQLCQNISDLTLQLEYARQELTAQRMKEKSLQDQISKKDHEKSELMDKNDRAIRELSEKHEKLRLQLEEQIQRKTEELATMQKMLDAKRNDSTIGTKRAEKKLSDATNHIEKLKSQLKELNAEKKELAKKLSAQEQEMSSMEKELKEQKHQQELREKEHEELVSIVEKLNAQLELNNQKMMTSEKEIARLQKTESEFKEFQRQLYMNSPPASTQLPPDISATVTQTPKSPALSLRLNSMKTPRSILKQPGSACKRRRVLFAQPSDNKISNTVSVTDIDSDDGLLSQDLLEATPPCPNKTPDIRSKSIQSLERSETHPSPNESPQRSNIRTTRRSSSRPKFANLASGHKRDEETSSYLNCVTYSDGASRM
ncbi:hypothetical protein CLF_113577 [Clonorchis sinensis]|uniref:Uncharacterized protein n=1 Tax=Clonorchis sinensis TaxID=79923 RepID=G7YMW6_CLOSI|nr:hypothetical protein CLF_113577 [Clonorchis sinensis]